MQPLGPGRATARRRGKSYHDSTIRIPSPSRTTCQVSRAAKRALDELRKSRPDVDALNLKLDIPGPQVPARPGVAPHPAPLMLRGGVPLPPYMGQGPAGMGGLGGIRMGGGGWGAGAGAGPGVGAGMGIGMGGARDPFMFGAGQAHQFLPPMLGPPPPFELNAYARVPQVPLPMGVPPVQALATRGGRPRRRKAR